MVQSKDLFDDSTMSFGEHLEELRGHLWKALVGLVIFVILALFFGDTIIATIRAPIDAALLKQGVIDYVEEDVSEEWSIGDYLSSIFGGSDSDADKPDPVSEAERIQQRKTVEVEVDAYEFACALHEIYPELYPKVPSPNGDADTAVSDIESNSASRAAAGPTITLRMRANEFAQFKDTRDQAHKPITLTVQEAFLTYIKVAVVTGLLFSSPWILYQIWLFVAAGLYPHERKYVKMYLPLSVFLFVGGAVFCFLLVFPFVLNFLLGFNKWLGVVPQIRLSEWISFAIMLPLMFGLSFQLPLVMLFLDRINVFSGPGYREKRRMAIFIISIISMVMTPADPMSMMLMMVPLVLLYEFGILLCGQKSQELKPFEGTA